MLSRGLNLHDPRYIGHQVPAPSRWPGLFDAVGSVTNQVMAIYDMGPWATAVERAMVARAWARPSAGSRQSFAGAGHARRLARQPHGATHGPQRRSGRRLGPRTGVGRGRSRCLLVHADSHYSVARAAGILGLGSRQIVRVGLDERGRMDPVVLDAELLALRAEGRPVVAVVACACATPIGAFDPLEDIAEVCRRHGVWLHVDAAHGGAAVSE